MKISARSITTVLASLAIAACSPEPAAVSEDGGADLILTNGRVYTLTWTETSAPRAPSRHRPLDGSNAVPVPL